MNEFEVQKLIDNQSGQMTTEYITKFEALEAVVAASCDISCYDYEKIEKAIQDILPADVRLVVRGQWEWDENGMDWGLGAWKCSECKAIPQTWWNADKANPLRCSGSRFCGNCGADMREISDNSN